jgi:hypothetical protein
MHRWTLINGDWTEWQGHPIDALWLVWIAIENGKVVTRIER